MRRAARVGDVWYPIGSNKANMLDTLPRLEAGIAKVRDLTRKAGRDPAKLGIAYRIKRHGQPAPLASDGVPLPTGCSSALPQLGQACGTRTW